MGCYVALEGPDGGGKTTQADRLCARLEAQGQRVLRLREPGSTPLGEALRSVLLAPETGELSTAAEAMLFFAARAEMVRKEVAPALAEGRVVVAERSFLSTMVYQGPACDDPLPPAALRTLVEIACGAVVPDCTFVLDVAFEVGTARRAGAADDRIEARGAAFHKRVRQGYLDLADEDARVEVVDAARDAGEVHEDLWQRVTALLATAGGNT